MPIVESAKPPQLTISGEIDIASAGELRKVGVRLARSLGAGMRLDLDVAEVTFIDSSGLGALVAIRNAARSAGVTVALLRPTPTVVRLFDLSGLRDAFLFTDRANGERSIPGRPTA